MPVSSKPRKKSVGNPKAQETTAIRWDELREPIENCELILGTLSAAIYQATQPCRLRLTQNKRDEFVALSTSTNKDLTELQTELTTIKNSITPMYGKEVDEQSILLQYNYGMSLMNILERASDILRPDVARLSQLRVEGMENQIRFVNSVKSQGATEA